YVLAVGARRRGGHVPFASHIPPHAFAELSLPYFLSIGADAQKDQILAVLAGEENAIFPDDRCGPALARHGKLPDNVFRFAPFGWQVCFLADAVVRRAAPLGPIVSNAREAYHQ